MPPAAYLGAVSPGAVSPAASPFPASPFPASPSPSALTRRLSRWPFRLRIPAPLASLGIRLGLGQALAVLRSNRRLLVVQTPAAEIPISTTLQWSEMTWLINQIYTWFDSESGPA
ncbi:MAG: hypothetical protein HC824_09670 [Synechococcales cyanobacterium RM1_1_8]|nr:hypothetical protein [Synechococcales cyanobacterium RM1_1_8]